MKTLNWPIKGIGVKPGITISQWFGNPGIVSQDTYYGNKLIKAGQSLYQVLGMKGHNGIDISCPIGTPIYAAHDGNLSFIINNDGGYGLQAIIVNAGDGLLGSTYGHMSVFEGKDRPVKAGDLIGYSGNSGYSSGAHCHFGYWLNGTPHDNGYEGYLDPLPAMKIVIRFIGWTDAEKGYYVPADSMDRLQQIMDSIPALIDYQFDDSEINLGKRQWPNMHP